MNILFLIKFSLEIQPISSAFFHAFFLRRAATFSLLRFRINFLLLLVETGTEREREDVMQSVSRLHWLITRFYIFLLL